jgi:ribosomal protein L33
MANEVIKLECKEDGKTHFVTTTRNKKNIKKRLASAGKGTADNKLSIKRYNPVLRKHCVYTETSKLK